MQAYFARAACRYFRQTRLALPLRFNAIAHLLLDGNLTRGGDTPVIVHYTHHKPFNPNADLPGYQYLCTRKGRRRRRT